MELKCTTVKGAVELADKIRKETTYDVSVQNPMFGVYVVVVR